MIGIAGKSIIPVRNRRGPVIGVNGIDLDRDPNAALYYPGYPYTGATILDRSGQFLAGTPNNGTITGATWTRHESGLWYLNFGAIGNLVTVADAASIQNLFGAGATFKIWIKADSDGQGDAGRIYQKGNAWFIQMTGEAAGKAQMRFYQYFDTTDGSWITTATEVTIGAWTHVVVTYNSSNIANDPIIYVNGAAVGLTENGTPVGTRITDVGSNLIIGNRADTTRTFDGGLALETYVPTIWSVDQVTTSFARERSLFGVY